VKAKRNFVYKPTVQYLWKCRKSFWIL